MAQGILRGPALMRHLREAGLIDLRFATTLIERIPPLDDATRRFWSGLLAFFASEAAGREQPDADRAFWSRLREEGGVERLLDDPDLVLAEGAVLVVGRVPEAAGRS